MPSFALDSWPAYQSHFIGGAISLAAAYAAMHPLDTIKTNMQAMLAPTQRGKRQTFTVESVRATLFNVNVWRSLLKGFTVSIVGAAPQGGIRFSTYEFVKCRVIAAQEHHARNGTVPPTALASIDHPFLTTAFSAACGDLASSVVKIPREVITQRMQTGQYTTTSEAISHIIASEGIRGMYTGYVSTALRDIPFMIILFSVYETAKTMSGGLCADYVWASAMAGAVSGGLAGWATTPVDCVKTRIMTQSTQSLRSALKSGDGVIQRAGMYETTSALYKSGGVRALFTGATARSVWWFCVCGMFFPSYEASKNILYRYYDEKIQRHQTVGNVVVGAVVA